MTLSTAPTVGSLHDAPWSTEPSEAGEAERPRAPAAVGRSFVFPIIVGAACAPAAGAGLAAAWLLVVVGLIAGELGWFSPWGRQRSSYGRSWGVFSWLQSAAYAIAAMYLVLFHTGEAQTFGVTLYGVIMFQILIKHYANPKRLALNLVPPVVTMALVELAATALRIEHGQSLKLVTLLASPVIVLWIFRSVQRDLTLNRGRLAEAAIRAETAARQIQEAHRIALLAEDLAGIGHWRFDAASQHSTWSDGVYRVYGLDPSNGVPSFETLLALYSPEDREVVLANYTDLLQSGTPFSVEARVCGADGVSRHVIANGAAERGASGAVTTLFGVIMDVTEIRLREQALRDSEQRYRMLTERATDVIVRYDPLGVIEFASPSVRQFGYSPEDLVGRNMAELVHPDDAAQALKNRSAITQGGVLEPDQLHEFRSPRADGQWVWLQGSPAPICDDNGKTIGAVTVLRDVTARRAIEEELRRKRSEAEAAAAAKSEFLANMSHEIRTPLTAIIGFSGLMAQMDDLPAAVRGYVQRIVTSGRALLAVVNDILDFSKLEAGQVELDSQPFDVAQFFEETLALTSGAAEAKGLGLKLEIDAQTPVALCADSLRLRQVMLNLVNNAVKFTNAGVVRLNVSHDAQTNCLQIAVSDTGCGIPEDRLDRLFQRFSQADGSVSRRYGGTGLGLSISKTLVELMGGGIQAQSTQGAGSTFSFWIATTPAPDGWRCANETIEDERSDVASAHILVVDDLDANRELIRAILEAVGHRVDEAAGGAEAVNAVVQTPFDLIFMDLQMPGMDGFAAAKAIRRLDSPARFTPIVALSANVLAEHADASALAGMNGHIGKPIVVTELLSAVDQWAGGQVSSEEAVRPRGAA